MNALAKAAIDTMPQFNALDITNMAWAFAHLSSQHVPLIDALSAAAIPRMRQTCLDDACLDRGNEISVLHNETLGLVHAFAAYSLLSHELFDGAADALQRGSEGLDSARQVATFPVPEEALLEDARSSHKSPERVLEPSVLSQFPEVVALLKPPGWNVSVGKEVHISTDNIRDPYSTGKHLQRWVQSRFAMCYPIAADAAAQHGIVHRLDTNTSGIVLCAQTYKAYLMAQLQFVTRKVYKEYVCLCHGRLAPRPRMLDAPLQVIDAADDELPHTFIDEDGQQARTEICAVAHLHHRNSCSSTCFSLVKVSLHTGRRHQIRAHLANEGCPLVGDVAYGGTAPEWCSRVFLHAHRLKLALSSNGDVLDVCSPLPDDLLSALDELEASRGCGSDLKALLPRA